MKKEEFYQKVDFFERKILETIKIDKTQYRKSNLKELDVHYLEFGRKNKIPILLVHGFGATGITNFKLLPTLIKTFRVILVDLPGFGKSDRSFFEFSSPEQTIKFFVMPLVSLVSYLKLKKFIIIAHSLGAFLAAHLSQYIKERLAAVFLVGAAGFT